MRYFFSILFCFCFHLLWAQEEQVPAEADTVERTKMERDYLPSSMRIGPAVNALIQTALDENGTYYGVQTDLAIRRFMFSVEYGHAELSRQSEADVPVDEAFQYSSSGDYYKLGIDVNLLRDKQTGDFTARDDVIYFGLKYAFSILDDQVSFRTRDNFWETSSISQRNENLGVHWIEMNAGVKVELFKNIFLGYTMRYRFGKRYSDPVSLVPYRVPGFGSGEDEANFGFDYYIFYRIPFKKR